FLPLLSRLESEHLRRRKYPRRSRAESDLSRHVRICPASDVFRGAVPAHRNSARARIVVDAALDPNLPADPYRAHFERRESAGEGSAGIRGVSKEGQDKA